VEHPHARHGHVPGADHPELNGIAVGVFQGHEERVAQFSHWGMADAEFIEMGHP
jgi:hypothetical protein